jgi:hypothetical protein
VSRGSPARRRRTRSSGDSSLILTRPCCHPRYHRRAAEPAWCVLTGGQLGHPTR